MILRSLRARLLAAFLVVIVAALGTVGIAAYMTGPGYFADAMGHLSGDPIGEQMAHVTQAAFVEAMTRSLLAAGVIAVLAAGVVSLAVAGRIARPVTALAEAARRVAHGHYAERVPIDEPGELGDLAVTFNEMASGLEATERRRVQLVGDVAHELRTPLATLDGYLEGLQDGVIRPTEGTWCLLRGETARLTRMVNDLSELWRAEARQLTLHPEVIDATVVARDAAARFEHEASIRGITLELPSGPVRAIGDRDRVAQVVSNYLSNALRHSPDGSTIHLTTASMTDTARIAVGDEGTGLTEDQLEAVFERFYRVDPARSRAAGGSGIGLAIVRALADAMDGQAWAESGGSGQGATFYLELPAA